MVRIIEWKIAPHNCGFRRIRFPWIVSRGNLSGRRYLASVFCELSIRYVRTESASVSRGEQSTETVLSYKVLSLHQPYFTGKWGERGAATEVMLRSGDEFICQTAAGIEVSRKGFAVRIDCDENTFILGLSFENTLLVCQENTAEASVGESGMFLSDPAELCNMVCQIVPLRMIIGNAERRIAFLFSACCTPFTAVVYTGNARHSEEQCIDQRQVGRV